MERRDFLTATAVVGGALATGAVNPATAASVGAAVAASAPHDPDADLLQMYIGVGLISSFMTKDRKPTPILNRVRALRSQLASQQVFMPIVRIRDDLKFRGGQCRILWRGEVLIDVDLPFYEDQEAAKNPARLLRLLETAARIHAHNYAPRS